MITDQIVYNNKQIPKTGLNSYKLKLCPVKFCINQHKSIETTFKLMLIHLTGVFKILQIKVNMSDYF